MSENAIKNIVIVGGGTAGWMAAAALSKTLGEACSIRLIESEAIGTVGVGEGTIPHIRLFNSLLQIDEADFVRNTQGTFKLGIQFNDWNRLGDSYMHGFGNEIGRGLGMLPFHQYWIKASRSGKAADISAYLLSALAAPRGKFMVSASDVPRLRRWPTSLTPIISTQAYMRVISVATPRRGEYSAPKASSRGYCSTPSAVSWTR